MTGVRTLRRMVALDCAGCASGTSTADTRRARMAAANCVALEKSRAIMIDDCS
jgi:hypothetical protein